MNINTILLWGEESKPEFSLLGSLIKNYHFYTAHPQVIIYVRPDVQKNMVVKKILIIMVILHQLIIIEILSTLSNHIFLFQF